MLDLGLHTTLKDPNSILDPEVLAITPRIIPNLSQEFGTVWDLYQTKERPVTTDEFEIYTRNYTRPEITLGTSTGGNLWDNVATTQGLPVTAGTIDRITIGDVILVQDEIVVVKDVDRSANTIDVYERGAGDTVAVAHGTTGFACIIIGNTHEEGKVAPEAMAEGTSILKNWCQLVEEKIDLSKANTDQARKIGRTEDVLKREAMERVIQDLARSAIYNTGRANTATIPALTRGLLGHLDQLAGALKVSVSGAFSETVLKNALDEVRIAGGSINAIVMSVKNKRIFNGFSGVDQVNTMRTDTTGGRVLDSYLADGMGVIRAVVDVDMPDDKVALVNTNYMHKGWKVADELRFAEEPNRNSRENIQTLQGKFFLAMEGVGRTHYLITDLTTGNS